MHVQLEQILDNKMKRDQKFQLSFLKSREQKQSIVHAPYIQHH